MKSKSFLIAFLSIAILMMAAFPSEAGRPGRGGVVVPPPPIQADDFSPR